MYLMRHGEGLLRWSAPYSPVDGARNFRVDLADLDGDGIDEVVVAMLESMSNGMGVGYWTLWVIADNKLHPPLEVEDYGSMGFLATDGTTCRLLATNWRDGSEPGRGEGRYLVARWLELSGQRLRESPMRPSIMRRYTASLERIRTEAMARDKPALWFRTANPQPFAGTHQVP